VLDYALRVNVDTELWSTDSLSDPRLSIMAHKASAKFLFMLILLENHQKKHSEYLLACTTELVTVRGREPVVGRQREIGGARGP